MKTPYLTNYGFESVKNSNQNDITVFSEFIETTHPDNFVIEWV